MISRFCNYWHGLALALALALQANVAESDEYETLIEHSIGTEAMAYRHQFGFGFQSDVLLIDGAVQTLPIDSTTFDRTAATYNRFWVRSPLGSRLGLRSSLWSKTAYRKEEGDEEPRKIAEEQWSEGKATLEFVFYTQTKLEVFAGGEYHLIPEYTKKSETASVETEWQYESVGVLAPHIGVVKRTNFVHGGFYYKQGSQEDRAVVKSSPQDENILNFNETQHSPTTIAMFVRIPFGKGHFMGEFAAVQGSEGGNKTDDGDTVREDYNLARGVFYFPFGVIGTKTTIIHKTLSYSDNRSVTLDTIPMTALHFKVLIGSESNHGFVGLIYGYGKDGQSIPEFNADYKVNAYGASAGFGLSF